MSKIHAFYSETVRASLGDAPTIVELLQFIQEHQIDIIFLNETRLFNGHGFKLPNFHSCYTNTSRIAGHSPSSGTATLANIPLIHHQVQISTDSLTNTSIHIDLGNSEMKLSSVYKSPNIPLLTSDLDSLLNSNSDTIIAGDLNTKYSAWNS